MLLNVSFCFHAEAPSNNPTRKVAHSLHFPIDATIKIVAHFSLVSYTACYMLEPQKPPTTTCPGKKTLQQSPGHSPKIPVLWASTPRMMQASPFWGKRGGGGERAGSGGAREGGGEASKLACGQLYRESSFATKHKTQPQNSHTLACGRISGCGGVKLEIQFQEGGGARRGWATGQAIKRKLWRLRPGWRRIWGTFRGSSYAAVSMDVGRRCLGEWVWVCVCVCLFLFWGVLFVDTKSVGKLKRPSQSLADQAWRTES